MKNLKNQLINEMEQCMNEAWQYFKKQEKLPSTLTLSKFNKIPNISDLQEKWGAYRHVYASASFTKKYGKNIAKILGDLNEIKRSGSYELLKGNKYEQTNEVSDRRMDLKNNRAGRNIGIKYNGTDLLEHVYSELDKNPQIILNQHINNESPYVSPLMDETNFWLLMDAVGGVKNYIKNSTEKIKNKNELHKTGVPTGFATDLQDDYDFDEDAGYEQPMSLRERLLQARQEKLARYTQKLAQSPDEIAELESKHVSLDELKAPQEAKKQKLRDIIEGKVEFDENADFSSYENKKSGDNKIFTQEEIDEMSEEEREKNKDAIFYQKQTIGVPTREQAEKSAAKGGMIHVEAYTRKDGTKVRSYYRSR